MRKIYLPISIVVILVVGYLVFFARPANNQNGMIVQPPPAVTPSPDIQSAPFPPANISRWNTFISPNLGYAIMFPPGWIVSSLSDIYSDFNNNSDDDYIRNQNVGALEMTQDGIWITIEKFSKDGKDFNEVINDLSRQRNVNSKQSFKIVGLNAIRQFESDKPNWEGERWYYVVVYINASATVYRLSNLSFIEGTYRKYENVVNEIINSFRLR